MNSLLVSLFLISTFTVTRTAWALEFKDLSELIAKKNERVLAKDSEAKAAEKREGYFVRSLLPKIEVSAAQESFKRGTQDQKTQPVYGAEARVNLFNGGRDRIKSEKYSIASKRLAYEKREVLSEELDRARELYWEILYQRDLIQILQEAEVLNSENLKAADRRIRGGVATQSDRVEFEMKDVDLKRDLINARASMTSLRQKLAALLALEKIEENAFKEQLSHQHDWEEEIKHSHDDHDFLFKPVELAAQESDLSAKESGRSWLPRLDAFAAYNQYNQREEDFSEEAERRETVVGIRLSMTLFDGMNSNAESSALSHEANAARLLSFYKRRDVEAHIESELAELKALHGQVHEAEENIERSSRYYKLTKSEYQRGVKNSPDMLGASEKVFDMKKKKVEILRDFQISRSHLLSKTGR